MQAGAGMGKSAVLAELAALLEQVVHTGSQAPDPPADRVPVLWDIPPDSSLDVLPAAFTLDGHRLIVAKRSQTNLPGLSRALAYGKAHTLGANDLLFNRVELSRHFTPAMAERLLQQTGGWPVLLGIGDGGQLDQEFLEREVLDPLSPQALIALGEVLAGRPAVLDDAEALAPFTRRSASGDVEFALGPLKGLLSKAHGAVLERRIHSHLEAERIADAYMVHGRTTDAITILQRAGHYDWALDILRTAHGQFYIYQYGTNAYDQVLAGFPEEFARNNELLLICFAQQALKRGDVARARLMLHDYLSPANIELSAVLANADYSLALRFFRVMMLIYEDVFVTDELFELTFRILDEMPADAHLERGSFYNSILEFYVRRRRFSEAEDVALRAHDHYRLAQVPILQFFISVHQAIIRLMLGDAVTARKHALNAGVELASVDFDSPTDARLLALLNACVDYEGGEAEPLARFLSHDIDDFSHGEIWPSLIEFVLQYGSQALSEHFSTIAARSFLDRWRVYQMHNRQLQTMIDIREAIILQNGNRWQEAAAKLASLRTRITRAFVFGATDELSRLQDRDEIAIALTWLRHIAFETPTLPQLDTRLASMLGNLHITGRQKAGLEIWLAYVSKRQRNPTKARAVLQKTFEYAAHLGSLAPLIEEKFFLTELIGNQRIGDFLLTSGPIRQVLRRLGDIGLPNSALGVKNGLSRREIKILLMICEGGSNKFIANALGLSEATVKFHLGNVYRKLGCKKRGEAISAARALGLVT